MRVVNAYSILPDEIQAGDVLLFTVKAMVVRPGFYRIYRCSCNSGEDIPQGSRLPPEQERAVCKVLFPSLALVADPDIW